MVHACCLAESGTVPLTHACDLGPSGTVYVSGIKKRKERGSDRLVCLPIQTVAKIRKKTEKKKKKKKKRKAFSGMKRSIPH